MSQGSLERFDVSLGERLSSLRRRMLLVGALTTLGWGLAAAVVLWLVFAWLDLLWELSPELRIGFGGLTALTGLAVILFGVLIAFARSRPASVARRVDRAGEAGGQIVSGYDLSQQPLAASQALANGTRERSPLTHGLAVMAVERAGQLAADVPAGKTVPLAPIYRAAGGMLLLCATIAAVVVLFPALAENQWLRFFDPFGDHPPFSRITFDVEPGNAEILYGSGLDIYATAEGPPVERVDLVLRQTGSERDEVLPMFREPTGRWRTVLSRVTIPAEYHVRAGRSRSHRYDLAVITIPKLERVRFRVTPPEYTRRPAYDGPLPQGGLSGLVGTRVELWAKSNRPLARGSLTLVTGHETTQLPLLATGNSSHEVHGAFEIREAGKFEIGVTDVAGHESSDKLSGSIALLNDDKPFVRMTQPQPTALATPEAMLPVALVAEDDYGISRLQLFRSLNESRALPLDFELPQPSPTRHHGYQTLPLSAYGLAPGDVIKLFARVEDNDPAGSKGFESPVAIVRIISQGEYESMLRRREGLQVLMSKYRQAERRLESLAEEQAGLRKMLKEATGKHPSEEAKAAMKKLAKRLQKESQEIRKSAEHLLPYDLDKKLAGRLTELAESLEHEAGSLAEMADLPMLDSEDAAKRLEELLDKLAGKRKEFEKEAMEPLEHLEQIYPLIEDQSKFVAIYQQQRDLAERLSSLKGRDQHDDPALKARMRGLEEEQRRLRESLVQLLDDIEEHAAKLPEDEKLDDLRASALEFADAVRASGATPAMSDAETALAGFAGTDAHAAALKAADILETFLKKGEGVAGKGQLCLKFQPGLGEGLGDTIGQLLAEMGLGMADGSAGQGRNGYSTRRSSLDNVGLYGQLPGMDEQARRGQQRDGPGVGGGGSSASSTDNAATMSTEDKLRAAGPAGAAVPPRYRSRVGAYFQRVIEESSR